jgi:hypothetical protein
MIRLIPCGVCILLALFASASTHQPDIEYPGAVSPDAFGGGALLAGGANGLGRLPPTHRVHQSKPLWAGLVAVYE